MNLCFSIFKFITNLYKINLPFNLVFNHFRHRIQILNSFNLYPGPFPDGYVQILTYRPQSPFNPSTAQHLTDLVGYFPYLFWIVDGRVGGYLQKGNSQTIQTKLHFALLLTHAPGSVLFQTEIFNNYPSIFSVYMALRSY